jgi:hypothetical protein
LVFLGSNPITTMMWLYGFLIFASGYCAAFVTIWIISWLEMDVTDAAMRRAGFIERSYRPKLVTAGIGKAAYRGGA